MSCVSGPLGWPLSSVRIRRTTTAEGQRIAELEQEVRELRRANHILKTASAFFAAELDRPTSR